MMPRLLLTMALFVLGGCGYSLPGQLNTLPEDVRTVFIGAFANRTLEPFVENKVANSVIAEFSRSDLLSVTEKKRQADAILTGTVRRYSRSAVAYDAEDNIAEYRSAMTVEAVLKRRDNGRVLWKGDVEWSEEFPAYGDPATKEDNEALAIEAVSERIAEQIHARILDGF